MTYGLRGLVEEARCASLKQLSWHIGQSDINVTKETGEGQVADVTGSRGPVQGRRAGPSPASGRAGRLHVPEAGAP